MKKKVILISAIIIILISLLFYRNRIMELFNPDNKYNNLEYNSMTIEKMKELNIIDDVLKQDKYSKTLEVAVNSNMYERENFPYYSEIVYKEYNNLIDYINSLIAIGYSSNEINNIFDNLKEDSIMTVMEYDYNNKLNNYFGLSYFKESNLSRYLNYNKKYNDYSIENIITYVNIGLDYDFYTNIIPVNTEDYYATDVLVNKYNKLPDNYVPKNLKLLPTKYSKYGNDLYLVDVALTAFKEMVVAAEKDGIYLRATSTYRSIADQRYIYTNYVSLDGTVVADTYSARAGHSEHHTGLAIDYSTKDINYNKIEGTPEEKWVIDNAHKYGYHIRYKKNTINITGYKYEPWHIRYFGVELATILYNNDLTYEEYLARQ